MNAPRKAASPWPSSPPRRRCNREDRSGCE
jgi:hypothetical protein